MRSTTISNLSQTRRAEGGSGRACPGAPPAGRQRPRRRYKPTTGRGPRRAEGHARRRAAAARPCRRAYAQRRAEDAADVDGDRLDDRRRRGETLEVEGVEVELERLGLDDEWGGARDRELQRLAARHAARVEPRKLVAVPHAVARDPQQVALREAEEPAALGARDRHQDGGGVLFGRGDVHAEDVRGRRRRHRCRRGASSQDARQPR